MKTKTVSTIIGRGVRVTISLPKQLTYTR